MITKDKLFVRTDYKQEGLVMKEEDFQAHLIYLKGIAKERYFIGGGFVDAPGGMIIFSAKNIEEARKIADGDPIISKKFYKYDLVEWKVVISSDL